MSNSMNKNAAQAENKVQVESMEQAEQTEKKPATIVRRVGGRTYTVLIHFNEAARERRLQDGTSHTVGSGWYGGLIADFRQLHLRLFWENTKKLLTFSLCWPDVFCKGLKFKNLIGWRFTK